MNTEAASLSVLSISVTASVLSHFLPPIADVHHGDANSDFGCDVRVGELTTAGFLVAVGGAVSFVAGSGLPLVISIVLAVFIIATYEFILRNRWGVVNE